MVVEENVSQSVNYEELVFFTSVIKKSEFRLRLKRCCLAQVNWALLAIGLKKQTSVTFLSPVQTTQEEFKNGRFTMKTHQVFRLQYAAGFKSTTITGHLGFVFEENSGREIP